MSAAKHTPGPWSIFDYQGEGVDHFPGIEAGKSDAGGTTIVMWGDEDNEDAGVRGRTAAENLANAHLIAAAPDLADALEAQLGVFVNFEPDADARCHRGLMPQLACGQCSRILAARAALRKAGRLQ